MKQGAIALILGVFLGYKCMNPLIHVAYLALVAGAYILGKHFA